MVRTNAKIIIHDALSILPLQYPPLRASQTSSNVFSTPPQRERKERGGNTPYRWVACGDPKLLDTFVCFACAGAHAKHTNVSKRTICGVAATCTGVLPLQFEKSGSTSKCPA